MRSAVVTGTTRGVGRAIVEVLLQDGYHIIATDIAMPHLEQMKEKVIRQRGISDRRMDLVEFDLRNMDRIGVFVHLIKKCLSETNPLWGMSIMRRCVSFFKRKHTPDGDQR